MKKWHITSMREEESDLNMKQLLNSVIEKIRD